MPRRLLFLLPILLLGLVAVLAWRGLSSGRDPSQLPSVLIGKAAPGFDLPALDPVQSGLSPKDFAGQVTVVNFFASWCVPCRAEHPLLFQLAKDNHVPVFGIAFKDRPEDTAAYIREMGSPYQKIGVDKDGRIGIDYGITGVPETFILDRNGVIRYRIGQPIDADRLASEIEPLLKSLAQ